MKICNLSKALIVIQSLRLLFKHTDKIWIDFEFTIKKTSPREFLYSLELSKVLLFQVPQKS